MRAPGGSGACSFRQCSRAFGCHGFEWMRPCLASQASSSTRMFSASDSDVAV